MNQSIKMGILCGGSPHEAGISLNSARSVLDHMEYTEIFVYYFHSQHSNPNFYELHRNRRLSKIQLIDHIFKNFHVYLISNNNLYSNTPQDFAYKFAKQQSLSQKELSQQLQSMNIIFPLMHGSFGEDGLLQTYLESLQIPYLGSNAMASRRMFNKVLCYSYLESYHFSVPLYKVIRTSPQDLCFNKEIKEVWSFFPHCVAKPSEGGSSIGVRMINHIEDLKNAVIEHRSQGFSETLVEEKITGTEFTVLVLSHKDRIISLIPSSIHLEGNGIFDYRSKYLPTTQTFWQTPGKLSQNILQDIRKQASNIFHLFQAKNYLRIDGFVEQSSNRIIFSDINVISGMEQTSFLFQQAASIGWSQSEILNFIVQNELTYSFENHSLPSDHIKKQAVAVIFGGSSSERQVSVMSGTNVLLKLQKSKKYFPVPYILDQAYRVWSVPMMYVLNHTVEGIMTLCHQGEKFINKWQVFIKIVCNELGIPVYHPSLPVSYTLDEWLIHTQKHHDFCFIALHGDIGENGKLQEKLLQHHIPFNGSGVQVSKICQDKYQTSLWINNHPIPFINTLPKFLIDLDSSADDFPVALSFPIVIKPIDDGCSIGIAILWNLSDFQRYKEAISLQKSFLAPHTLTHQFKIIELSSNPSMRYMLESYIKVIPITIEHDTLIYKKTKGYIELTVSFLKHSNGDIEIFLPSLTVASTSILSLEEKFQGGTGVNLTPPPSSLLSVKQREHLQSCLKNFIQILGLQNYGRIDIFYYLEMESILIIEVNTLPGLTPSTVFFQQATQAGYTPLRLLETIIQQATQEHHGNF